MLHSVACGGEGRVGFQFSVLWGQWVSAHVIGACDSFAEAVGSGLQGRLVVFCCFVKQRLELLAPASFPVSLHWRRDAEIANCQQCRE